MTYAEFKENFLPEFLKIKSFAGRIKYANQNLQRIGSGSGRIVYDIDGEKALKIAKNPRGIAQNESETDAGYYKENHPFITIVFDSPDDNTWLIAEKAKKVNEARIKQLTEIPSLSELQDFLRNHKELSDGNKKIFTQTPELEAFFWENEFASDLANFVANYNQHPGDFGRPSSYGEVLRDGQPTIVLTDYGINDETYYSHYSGKKPQKYRMFELYNYGDGNDDILSDLPQQDAVDTRQSMWALMPYGVGDGDGVINERFIKFVENTDKYPIRRILPNTPSLTDEFHDVVNNLTEVLNKVENKKKFYGNLLELQNYLIRGKFFDREPLEKEVMNLSEATPMGMGMDRSYGDKIAKSLAVKLNLGEPQYLGGGGFGLAYQINNNQVLKLTTDLCEVDAGGKTHRAKPKHLVYVDKIYKVIATEENKTMYALIEDFIPDKPVQKFSRYIAIVSSLGNDLYGGLLDLLVKGKSKLPEFAGKTFNDYPEMAKLVLTSNPEANINNAEREEAYQFMLGLYEIKQDLLNLGIKSNDYYEPKNLGYKNGILIYYDIGNCRAEEPQFPPENVVTLPEGKEESLDEGIDRADADKIANKVAEVFKLGSPKYLKSGTFGAAYDIGNNQILKVTTDKSEAVENLNLIGKPLEYIAEPYKVLEVKPKSGETKHYAIILEKLRTDNAYFGKMMYRLKRVFKDVFKVHLLDAIDQILYGYDVGLDLSKVKTYFEKNPTDAKFFNDISKIVGECKKYGIESTDFMNFENLGYKPNGNVGFFDVGFGNYFARTDKEPIPIEVDEDGSALFSTDDSIGRDNFPTYNNTDDGSPLQDNNLPVNIWAEDLQYNHVVGDATQDRFEISEELLEDVASRFAANLGIQPEFSDFEKKYATQQNIENKEEIITGEYHDNTVEVIKNPKSLQNVGHGARGIIDKDGNFFIETMSSNIHEVIAQVLAEKNEINYQPFWYKDPPVEFITVQRLGDTNKIFMGETNSPLKPMGKRSSNWTGIIPTRAEIKPLYQKFLDEAKQKNPRYEFINEMIQYSELYEKGIDPENFFERKPAVMNERQISYMPGATGVEVKKKCRLAGLGNTSTACNQGDINNLKLKSIDETVDVNIPAKLSGFNSVKIIDGDQQVGELEIMDRGIHGNNHYVAVDKVFIDKQFRGKGYANDAMKLLFQYADSNNIIITLTPDNMWGASVPKLKAWYKSLGFVENRGKKKDFQTMQLMYRLPKSLNEKIYASENVALPLNSENNDVAIALEDLERARSVKYWLEPEFSSESGRYPQEGKPNSFIESGQEGTRMGNEPKEQRAWKSKDIVAYDENGKIVGVFSMAISGPEKGAFKITTRKDAQRMGWGTKLLNRAEASGIDIVNNIKNNSFSSSGRDLLRSWLRKKLPQGLNMDEGVLNEYREQMEKVYGKTGIYDQDDMNTILSITGGDPYTKFIADIFYYLANRYNKEMVTPTKLSERDKEILEDTHERIKRYDKNVLPIHDLYAQEHNAHPLEKMNDLRDREVLIERIKTLPTVLLRNLRADLRKERDHYEFQRLFEIINLIKTSMKLIDQTNPEHRDKILKKVFSSANDTFEAVAKRLQDTSIPYLSQDDAAENIVDKVQDLGDEAEILYNQDNILVVKINTAEAMGYIGCSSQWCFASNPQQYWDSYTGNEGFATIVFNFNEAPSERNAMVVVLEGGDVYDMYNDYMEDGDAYLDSIGASKYIPRGEVEMAESTIFAKKNIMREAQLMSLQDLPFKAEVEKLGGKIYSVGGAVRDEFLGKESKDLDLVIKGIPIEELKNILLKYGRASIEGESFAVIKFKAIGATDDIDIAVPRTDKPTGGGGHRDIEVTADHTLPIEKDLERRDFTINAIAKDTEGNIIDPFGGREDMKNKIIRAANPDAFSDDPLRMLRAVQFASRFGFTIEPKTMEMIVNGAEMIKKEPAERLLTEFGKIVQKGNPRIGAQLLKDTGLFQHIFGFDIKQSTIDRNPFENVKTVGEFVYLLTHLLPDPTEYYLSRFSTKDSKKNKTYKEITALDFAHKNADVTNPIKARSIAHNVYTEFPTSLQSQILPPAIRVAAGELLSGKYPKGLGDLAVKGDDLKQLGYPQGKPIGDALKMMLLKVYADKVRNNKEELLSLLPGKKDVNEFEYPRLGSEKEQTWNVNGQEVGIEFFLEKYYIWNQGEHSSASKESVLRFLEDEFPQFIEDEKFKKDLLWFLTRNELLDENMEKNVRYSGVVLDDNSRQRLIQRFQDQIPEGWDIIAHHMTINLGPIDPMFEKSLGMTVDLTVNTVAIDDKVLAVGVTGFESKNAKPHITLAVNREIGGKPKDSNNLTNWVKLRVPLLLKGKVTEIT